MDTFLSLQSGRLNLLIAPRREGARLLNGTAARLALSGQVYMLDGGNCFDFHLVSRTVRRGTHLLEETLQRIRIARAFTCYQVVALLEQTPATLDPLLVLDLLATFADENVPLGERTRLLDACLLELRRLAWQAPVLVSASLSAPGLAAGLAEMLEGAADTVWRIEPVEASDQPRLF